MRRPLRCCSTKSRRCRRTTSCALCANKSKDSPSKDLFIFVHGFNNTFEDAAAAQRRWPTTWISTARRFCTAGRRRASWPLNTADEAQWYQPRKMGDFLETASWSQSGAQRIHVLAHTWATCAVDPSHAKPIWPESAETDERQHYFVRSIRGQTHTGCGSPIYFHRRHSTPCASTAEPRSLCTLPTDHYDHALHYSQFCAWRAARRHRRPASSSSWPVSTPSTCRRSGRHPRSQLLCRQFRRDLRYFSYSLARRSAAQRCGMSKPQGWRDAHRVVVFQPLTPARATSCARSRSHAEAVRGLGARTGDGNMSALTDPVAEATRENRVAAHLGPAQWAVGARERCTGGAAK